MFSLTIYKYIVIFNRKKHATDRRRLDDVRILRIISSSYSHLSDSFEMGMSQGFRRNLRNEKVKGVLLENYPFLQISQFGRIIFRYLCFFMLSRTLKSRNISSQLLIDRSIILKNHCFKLENIFGNL